MSQPPKHLQRSSPSMPGVQPARQDGGLAQALALHRSGRLDEAGALYNRLLRADPEHEQVLELMAAVLIQQSRMPEAIRLMQRALGRHPRNINLLNNLGAALLTLGRNEDALRVLDRALALDAKDPTARKNRGIANDRLRPSPAHAWHTRQAICDWSDYEEGRQAILKDAPADAPAHRPFLGLLIDDPLFQLNTARRWAGQTYAGRRRLFPEKRYSHERLRVGYFSSDFYNHAVMVLMSGVLARHDKQRFEVIGFSTGRHTNDAMRLHARRSMDQFIDVSRKPDEAIAHLARSLEIDVAIDLGGHTQDARPGVFSYGAAPVQINYLGYPGTMGTQFHDYILADQTIIPASHRQFFSEKVITLPDTYQPTDASRPIALEVGSRSDHDLPDRAVVFCCFNNPFKITPEVFGSWMRILNRVPHSVLWLLETLDVCTGNLRVQTRQAGIDPSRLVFAKRVHMPQHLARHALADLFLDTLPYNAHTTASDALFSGLPVLTRMGTTFSGRVAASLNRTMGLDELITNSIEDYEELAVALALDPGRLRDLRLKVQSARQTSALFNTDTFTRHLEAAILAAHQRCHDGLMPDHIEIGRRS
jgi:predicted O-linked N-acetylglucosamine transferase (SPINDLY family)